MRLRDASALVLAASMTLNGCAGSGAGPLGIGAIVGDRNLATAEPLFSKEEQNCLGSADRLIAVVFGSTNVSGERAKGKSSANCDQIRSNFRQLIPVANGQAPTYSDAQRNEVVDALIAASNRKCTRYAALLKNADGAMNSGLSVGAIITGGLGSILGGVNTAKALAGSSSILSGSRAALNDTYLSNQTIHVLTAAFEKARREQRRAITNRQACTVSQYTLMRGIEDAFAYHNSCSLVAGLAETALSIERSENPGLDTMRRQLAEMTNLRRQMAELTSEGPISPIAPAPTPASLDKLITADQGLAAAQKSLADARGAEQTARSNLDKATQSLEAAPADKNLAEAVSAATKALGTATAAVASTIKARDAAAFARDGEVRALVRQTSPAIVPTDPETRACPFNAPGSST